MTNTKNEALPVTFHFTPNGSMTLVQTGSRSLEQEFPRLWAFPLLRGLTPELPRPTQRSLVKAVSVRLKVFVLQVRDMKPYC